MSARLSRTGLQSDRNFGNELRLALVLTKMLEIALKEPNTLKLEEARPGEQLCTLEANAKRDAIEIAILKAGGALSESNVKRLTTSLERAETRAEELHGKINDLEQVGQKQAAQNQGMRFTLI